VYALAGQSDARATAARAFIEKALADSALVISYQVVNETMRVLKRAGKQERDLRQIIDNMFELCEVSGFTQTGAALASELRETMLVSYWDSHIAASAVLADCDTLISEDFQNNARIRGMQVKNPFTE
jgi:predicted nucleic acid-binding protein